MEWEKKYIELPVDDMLTLIICSNFLKIEGLVNLIIKAVSLQVQGKSKEELEEIFTIRYSDSYELQKLKDANAWACETYSLCCKYAPANEHAMNGKRKTVGQSRHVANTSMNITCIHAACKHQYIHDKHVHI